MFKTKKFILLRIIYFSMKRKPLFSVLMANYNNSRYIKKSIESVLNQTYNNWELIIVDDASTDNSLKIIKPYLKNQRIKLIKHKKNLGCGATKKRCADNAKGEIFGVLDPDDVLSKKAIDLMVKTHLRNSECSLVYSKYNRYDTKMKFIERGELTKKWKKDKTSLNDWCMLHFVSFKKKYYNLTSGFDSKQKRAVDRDIAYKLEEKAPFIFIPRFLYKYRVHKNSLAQPPNHKKAWCYEALAAYKAYKRRLGTKIPNLTKEEITNRLLWAYDLSIELKDPKLAISCLTKALRLNLLDFLFIKKKIIKRLSRFIIYFYNNQE